MKLIEKPILLITGAGGFLGRTLCLAAAQRWRVVGTYRRRKPRMPEGHWHQIDLTRHQTTTRWVETLEPAAVIHAAAVAQVAECQSQPQETELINVATPALLADICARAGIPLAFISTDLVFDGLQAPYDETRTPRPRSVYGDQKARAENQVLDRCPAALVCRLPLLIGPAPDAVTNFTLQMLEAIALGRPISLFVDEYRTPVDVWSAAQGILQFLGHRSGLLHLGGRTRISRHALGLLAARHMGKAPTSVRAVHMDELPGAELRSPDCSLVSQRAFENGYGPLSLDAALLHTIEGLRRSEMFQSEIFFER